MNDGFAAMWLLAIGLILYMTGWQAQVADRTSRWAVAAFLVGVALLHGFVMPVAGGKVELYGSAAWALLWGIVSIIWMRNVLQSLFVILCALLAGAVWLWVRFMYASDPVFVLVQPGMDGALIAGFLAGMLAERFAMQAFIVIIATSMSQFFTLLLPGGQSSPITIGQLSWWDGLTVALAGSRLTWNVKAAVRGVARWISEESSERGGNS